MNTLKTKAEPKKPVYEIEVNDVFYLYAVGLQWIAISTKPDSQWGDLPEWCKVCFAVETSIDRAGQLPCSDDIESIVRYAIKGKIHEQRKAHESQAGRNKPLAKHPDQPGQETALHDAGRKGRKKITASLFDESDNGTACGVAPSEVTRLPPLWGGAPSATGDY